MERENTMKKTRRILALVLTLALALSLFGGASVAFAEEPTPVDTIASNAAAGYQPATALEEGYDYVIVTESEGKTYAMGYDGESDAIITTQITLTDGIVAEADASLLWNWHSDSTLESVGTPGQFLYPCSGGFLPYESGRNFSYDAETGIVFMHTKYWLSFADGAFNQTETKGEACKVSLFAAASPVAEPAVDSAADDTPVTCESASALEGGYDYVIVTEYEGKTYAMSFDGDNITATEVTVADGKVDAVAALRWNWDADYSTLESVGTPGQFLYPCSSGFLPYKSGRTFNYDAATGTVAMHTKYWLTFANGAFNQTESEAEACKVTLFRAKAAEKEEEYVDDTPVSQPDTVVKEATKNADGSITLAFVSDVHHSANYDQMNLQVWLENVKKSVGYIDSFGVCGDFGSAYANDADDYWAWTQDVLDYVDTQVAAGVIGSTDYTFGNHEWFPSAGGDWLNNKERPAAQRLLRVGEAIRTDDYILYNFGAGKLAAKYTYDYTDEDIAILDAYLSTAPTDRPIFILTHFPLHASSSRTVTHAKQVIDVLNKYNNIIVLWGHNHSDFDTQYDTVVRAGESIVYDAKGSSAVINFDCLSAGCISDEEYTGAKGGSAWVLGKGLVITLNADGTRTYDYYTMDGEKMPENGPYLVEFRENVTYKTLKLEHVEYGKAATAPATEIEGYTFTGWDVDFSNITRHLVVTGQYEVIKLPTTEGVELDPNYVYVTIQDGQNTAIGKSGTPIALYAVPFKAGMTIGDAFVKVHELEYAGGTAGITIADSGYGFANASLIWGRTPAHGTLCFDNKNYIDFNAAATAGGCYYALAYDSSWISTSFVAPGKVETKAGEAITLFAETMDMNSDYTYSEVGITGDVYVGTSYDKLADSGVDSADGYFTLTLDKAGEYIIAVRSDVGEAVAFVTVTGSAAETPVVVEPVVDEPVAEPVDGEIYIVAAGDTLWSIAQKYYGTGKLWGALYAANASTIANPRLIYVGQQIIVP